MTFKEKSIRILLGTFLVYGLLVATHEGEFWPFSIYPMFSQAGNPWTRALVQDVTDLDDEEIWEVTDLQNLPGSTAAVSDYGVDQIDFSNYISKTRAWNDRRKNALIRMFGADSIKDKYLLIMKVRGELAEGDTVSVLATPFLLMASDTVITNPELGDEQYFTEE